MIAWTTRLLLLLQIGAAALLGSSIHYHFLPHQAVWSIALGVASVILIRAAITAYSFMLSRRYRSPVPLHAQLNKIGALRLFFVEFIATMQSSSWTMPFCSFQHRIVQASTNLPVLLVHGYVCNSGYWHSMSQVMTAAGISHHAITLEPVLAPVEHYLPTLHRAVQTLMTDSGSDRVVLVGHSMGGLLCRAYLREYGEQAIARIITIGTPHHGTALANHGIGENVKQMAITIAQRSGELTYSSGPWLQQLADAESPRTRALITSIYSYHDNIVAPQSSSYLDDAVNIALPGIGHVALAMHKTVQQQLLTLLLTNT